MPYRRNRVLILDCQARQDVCVSFRNDYNSCGGPDSSCICGIVAEFVGVCLDGDTPRADLQDCNISADCNSGFVCAVGVAEKYVIS